MANKEVETEVDEKAERSAELKAQADKLNEGLEGKGLRWTVGLTKGRNPQPVPYKEFDEEQPETLPTTFVEFTKLSGYTTEPLIVTFLIRGMNAYNYALANDPIGAFCEPDWDEETVKAFKMQIKGAMVTSGGATLEEVVGDVKPGVMRGLARKAKALAEASAATVPAPVASPVVRDKTGKVRK